MAKAVERLLKRRFADDVEFPCQPKNDRLRRFLVDVDGKSLEIHGRSSHHSISGLDGVTGIVELSAWTVQLLQYVYAS